MNKSFFASFFSKKEVLAFLVLVLAARVAYAEGIHIASIGPPQLQIGAEQAVADLNEHGGVLGQTLELTVADDHCDPRAAVKLANQMRRLGLKLVDGHACASASIRASKVYLLNGVLQITPATTAVSLTDDGAWNIFRLAGRDDEQARVAGAYLAEHFPQARVAFVHDGTMYARDLAERTRTAWRGPGRTEALFTAATSGDAGAIALIEQLKTARIEMVYFAGGPADAARVLDEMRRQGVEATLMGDDALSGPDFLHEADALAEGTLLTAAADPAALASAAPLVAAFRARDVEPVGYVVPSYAAIQIWAQAAEKAQSVDPKKVSAMLKSGGPWPSVMGPVGFDRKGDVIGATFTVFVWRDGKLRPAS